MYEELIKRLREHNGWALNETLDEAADAIEDLEFACNRYEKDYKALCEYLPKWIPVTEQLPNVDETKDEYENVIVIASSRGWKKSRPLIYERACVRGKTVYRWKYISGRIYDGLPVTHWMPLPSTEGLNET